MTDPINDNDQQDPFTTDRVEETHAEVSPEELQPEQDTRTSVQRIAQTQTPQEPLAPLGLEEQPKEQPKEKDTTEAKGEAEVAQEPVGGEAQNTTEDPFEVTREDEGIPPRILAQTTNPGVNVYEYDFEEEDELSDTPDGPLESTNTVVEHEWTTPPVHPREYEKSKNRLHEGAFFHSEMSADADKRIRAYIAGDIFVNEDGVFYHEILNGANASTVYKNNQFDSAVRREGAAWRQLVKVENGKLGMSRPRLIEKGVQPATGERAMRRIKSLLGHGWIDLRAFVAFWLLDYTEGP